MKIYYGNVVVFGVFVLHLITGGILYSSSYNTLLMNEFGVDHSQVSWFVSIRTALMYALSLPAGYVADSLIRRGCSIKPMFASGGLFIAVGFVISAFAKEFWHLQICALIVGIGLGFSGPISAAVIQPWFTKAKGLATGFSLSAVGVGIFIYPLITNGLIEHFNQPNCCTNSSEMTSTNDPRNGWRMTMLVEGLYSGVAIILVACILRVPREEELIEQKEQKRESRTRLLKHRLLPSRLKYHSTETRKKGEEVKHLTTMQVLKDRPYLSLLLFKFIFAFAYFLFPHMLKSFGIDSGYSATTMSLLSATMGLVNAFARIVLGFIGDKVGRIQILRINMFLVFVAVVMWPFSASSVVWLWCVVVLYGLNFAPFEMYPPSIVADFYSKTAPDSQFLLIGMLYAIISPGALLGGVFFGAIYDAAASYVYSMIYAAAVMVLGLAVLFFMVPTLHSYEQKSMKDVPFVEDVI